MSDQNDHYMGAMLEAMDHKIDLILEAHAALAPLPRQVKKIDGRLTVVESDVKVIKSVVKATNRDLQGQEKRITKLESKVFS
jgi:hypothetical protein